MNKKTIFIIAGIAIGIMILAGIIFIVKNKKTDESFSLDYQINQEIPVVEIGKEEQEKTVQKLPHFTLQNFSGQTINSGDLKGDLLVIISWAASNPFSVNALSDLVSLQKELGDKIKIVAINRQESIKEQREFLDSFELSDKLIYLMDPNDDFYQSIAGTDMPETVFVDRDGNIVSRFSGYIKIDEMRKKAENLL